MFGIGGFELFLILLFGFLIFGPDKLPAMAKTLGKAIAKFRNAQTEMNQVLKTEVYDPNSDEPFKNPLEVLSKAGSTAKDAAKDVKSSAQEVRSAAKSTGAGGAKAESFSERKARYDRERAAKREAEKQAVKDGAATATATAATKAADKPASATPSADELFGTKPQAKKPDPKKGEAAGVKKPAAKKAAAATASTAKKTVASAEDASAAPATAEEKGE